MHPVAHPRGGGGEGGRSTGRGGRGGEGPSVVVQTDRLGVGIGGGGMTIEKVERRMRSYLTFSIKNRQVQVVKQAVFECSFVVLEPKVPKIIPGICHRIDREFFE